MKIKSFDWDYINENHIAEKHNVERDEAEEVIIKGRHLRRTRQDRYKMYGQTSDGRYLVVIFELDEKRSAARVITAMEMTEKEKSAYKKKIRSAKERKNHEEDDEKNSPI